MSSENDPVNTGKKPYDFGGIEEFDLAEIENEVLNDTVYLDVFAGSDPALKSDIEVMSEVDAQSILQLNTYRFNYDHQKFQDKNLPEGNRLGLMADEVERIFPECVVKDNEGYRYVNYSMLIAPLLETVKQLEKKIAILEKKVSEKI